MEVFAAQETSAHVMSILLAAIASVSLVVGGIGIRVAIGALKRDILRAVSGGGDYVRADGRNYRNCDGP
jgi:hypothetical protein